MTAPVVSKPEDEIKFVHDELRTAIRHIEHMAAWIGKQNSGYSFEGLGEDMPSIHAALECARTHARQANTSSDAQRQALQKLYKEVSGVWRAYEPELRAAMGHTNYAVVNHHLENAGVALVSPQQADARQPLREAIAKNEARWQVVFDLVTQAREAVRLKIPYDERPPGLFQALQDAFHVIGGRENLAALAGEATSSVSPQTGVMQAAAKASETVAGWSQSKRDHAERAMGDAPPQKAPETISEADVLIVAGLLRGQGALKDDYGQIQHERVRRALEASSLRSQEEGK